MGRQDFKLNEDGDFDFDGGDIVTNDADDQHVEHILNATKGTYKQTPLLGVGIGLELNGQLDGQLKRLIRLNLNIDDYKVLKIAATNGLIDLKYEDNNG